MGRPSPAPPGSLANTAPQRCAATALGATRTACYQQAAAARPPPQTHTSQSYTSAAAAASCAEKPPLAAPSPHVPAGGRHDVYSAPTLHPLSVSSLSQHIRRPVGQRSAAMLRLVVRASSCSCSCKCAPTGMRAAWPSASTARPLPTASAPGRLPSSPSPVPCGRGPAGGWGGPQEGQVQEPRKRASRAISKHHSMHNAVAMHCPAARCASTACHALAAGHRLAEPRTHTSSAGGQGVVRRTHCAAPQHEAG